MTTSRLTTTRAVRAPEGGGGAQGPQPLALGRRIREVRRANDWTLDEVSKRTGLAKSTLSKIENEQMSPTFEAVHKLATGLGIQVQQLFAPATQQRSSGRRTITRKDEGKPHPTATYEHELLATELSSKKMVPFKTRLHARDFAEFGDWVRHDGEEFLLVLEGTVALYTEFYEPVTLEAGDSVYYDSGMGHCALSVSEEDALILWVSAE